MLAPLNIEIRAFLDAKSVGHLVCSSMFPAWYHYLAVNIRSPDEKNDAHPLKHPAPSRARTLGHQKPS